MKSFALHYVPLGGGDEKLVVVFAWNARDAFRRLPAFSRAWRAKPNNLVRAKKQYLERIQK